MKKRNVMIVFITMIIIIIVITIYFIMKNVLRQEEIIEADTTIAEPIQKEGPLIATIEEKQEELQEETVVEEIKPTIPRQYMGFNSLGNIEIPKTGLNIPILETVTVKGLEVAPCILMKTGELNQSGNTLIVGHNYRNGKLFSNNKKLEPGDKIIVTNLDGVVKTYSIYQKFVTTAEDVSYLKREITDKPEITLQCCTDYGDDRIIILAKIED